MITVGGVRLEASWIGRREGPRLVFLHEGLGCVSLWRDFPEALSEETGLGAFVYSRAGYGRSDPAPLPRPMSFMHEEARKVLPELLSVAAINDAILIGQSDGASISLIYAGSVGPVRAVIAEAPHVFVEPICVESIGRMKGAYAETDLREKLARHHGANVDCAFNGWADVWLDPRFPEWNIEEFLPGICAPILVVQGDRDEYGTVRQVDAIQRGAGGRVESRLLTDCGHTPHRDRREETLQTMSTFIQGCLDTGGPGL